MPLDDLPDELLLAILSRLTRPADYAAAAAVSRRWHAVIADPHNWVAHGMRAMAAWRPLTCRPPAPTIYDIALDSLGHRGGRHAARLCIWLMRQERKCHAARLCIKRHLQAVAAAASRGAATAAVPELLAMFPNEHSPEAVGPNHSRFNSKICLDTSEIVARLLMQAHGPAAAPMEIAGWENAVMDGILRRADYPALRYCADHYAPPGPQAVKWIGYAIGWNDITALDILYRWQPPDTYTHQHLIIYAHHTGGKVALAWLLDPEASGVAASYDTLFVLYEGVGRDIGIAYGRRGGLLPIDWARAVPLALHRRLTAARDHTTSRSCTTMRLWNKDFSLANGYAANAELRRALMGYYSEFVRVAFGLPLTADNLAADMAALSAQIHATDPAPRRTRRAREFGRWWHRQFGPTATTSSGAPSRLAIGGSSGAPPSGGQ